MGALSLSLCTIPLEENSPDGGGAFGYRPGGVRRRVLEEVVPANVIFRSRFAGGLAGSAERTDLTEGGGLWVFHHDKLAAAVMLPAEEMEEVEALRARAAPVAVEYDDGPHVADGTYSMLIFQGRGIEDLETEVNNMARRLVSRGAEARLVWECPAIVKATASAPASSRTCVAQRLTVTETLKEPDGATIQEGADLDVRCVRLLPEEAWSVESAYCLSVTGQGVISTADDAWPMRLDEKTIEKMVRDQIQFAD